MKEIIFEYRDIQIVVNAPTRLLVFNFKAVSMQVWHNEKHLGSLLYYNGLYEFQHATSKFVWKCNSKAFPINQTNQIQSEFERCSYQFSAEFMAALYTVDRAREDAAQLFKFFQKDVAGGYADTAPKHPIS